MLNLRKDTLIQLESLDLVAASYFFLHFKLAANQSSSGGTRHSDLVSGWGITLEFHNFSSRQRRFSHSLTDVTLRVQITYVHCVVGS